MTNLVGYYTFGVNPESKYTENSIYRDFVNFTDIKFFVILIDKKKEEVLYFYSSHSKGDPRMPEIIERIVAKSIREIYYK